MIKKRSGKSFSGTLISTALTAIISLALLFSCSFTSYAAVNADNVSELDSDYTGSVVNGTYATHWGTVYGGNFDTGANAGSDLFLNTKASRKAGGYILGNVKIAGRSAVVLDANTGNILYSKNMDRRIFPASCTKVLTAVLAAENNDLDDMITVSENAVALKYNSSNIALRAGEKISVEQALYGLLMCSGNDCATALAEKTGGSVEGFARMMNEKASQLGCVDSHFTNAHGLYNKKHYTTAHDLAVIMQYAVKNKIFEKIDTSWRYNMRKTGKAAARELWNGHYMIVHKFYYLEGIVGGKNGYIDESRFNLITHYQKDGQDLIIVDCTADSAGDYCRDTQLLIKKIRGGYNVTPVTAEDTGIDKVTVKINGREKKVKASLASDMYVELKKGSAASDISYDFIQADNINNAVKKGDIIGTETASLDGKIIGTAIVRAESGTGTHVIINILIVLLLTVLVLIIWLAARIRKENRRRAKRARSRKRKRSGSIY